MLSLTPSFTPTSISQFLCELSRTGCVNEKVLRVNDLVNRLEAERCKIEAFERELPLCMLLINDAIVALKDELMVLKKSNAHPVLEEFIPLKKRFDDHDDDDNINIDDVKVETITNQEDNGDKKNWLSSTHLWNINNESINHKANSISQVKNEEQDKGRPSVNENNRLNLCFIPNVQPNIQLGSTMLAPPQQHTFRKQRRCWSGELHRLFVNALQQLGGSQVATPKQIRELMKVDGLTNDEVKSHLQKYRLHTRKCSSSKSSSPDGPLLNIGNNIDDEEDAKSEYYCWSGNL
ncbi:transcription factor HHO3-like [Bidens hawaiensis]|uniref:transcription factor HHO3-like n=1 Tax=Bidens hawaiensis TaxID=980011 RepID=UPI004049D1B1